MAFTDIKDKKKYYVAQYTIFFKILALFIIASKSAHCPPQHLNHGSELIFMLIENSCVPRCLKISLRHCSIVVICKLAAHGQQVFV